MSAEYRDRWTECTDEHVVDPDAVEALIRARIGAAAQPDRATPAPVI